MESGFFEGEGCLIARRIYTRGKKGSEELFSGSEMKAIFLNFDPLGCGIKVQKALRCPLYYLERCGDTDNMRQDVTVIGLLRCHVIYNHEYNTRERNYYENMREKLINYRKLQIGTPAAVIYGVTVACHTYLAPIYSPIMRTVVDKTRPRAINNPGTAHRSRRQFEGGRARGIRWAIRFHVLDKGSDGERDAGQ